MTLKLASAVTIQTPHWSENRIFSYLHYCAWHFAGSICKFHWTHHLKIEMWHASSSFKTVPDWFWSPTILKLQVQLLSFFLRELAIYIWLSWGHKWILQTISEHSSRMEAGTTVACWHFANILPLQLQHQPHAHREQRSCIFMSLWPKK